MAALVDKFSEMVHPKPTALIPVVDGSEEIEVVVMWDLLARAGVRVTLAHVGHGHPHHMVKLVRGTTVQAEKPIQYCVDEDYDLIVVPGGPGAKELGASAALVTILQRHIVARKPLGAICAAPVEVLHRNSLVPGTVMTCHPPLKEQLGELYSPEQVVVSDEGVVTSQAPGTAIPMALRLIEFVRGEKTAADVSRAIAYTKWAQEAAVILLDVGPSMATPLRERMLRSSRGGAGSVGANRRFDAAVAAVEIIIHQKLFLKSKDEVGVVIYGSAETDNQLNEEQGQDEYRNVCVLQSLDTPTLRLCEKLRELEPFDDPNVKVDILDGLIVALDLLYRRTEGKKCERKLLVITDAAAKINDPSDIEAVVQMITSMEVKLQVIGLDFHTTSDTPKAEQVVDAGELNEPSADVKAEHAPADGKDFDKAENEKMLVSIATEVGGHVSSVSKRMQLLAQSIKRTATPTTKFRGNLEIGTDGFGIPVYCYLKTKPVTLPTLVKESQASYEKETAGRVKMDRRYTNPRDPDEEVPPNHQVRAYRYGKEKVPFSSADVEFFKFQTEKSLKVLGFLDRSLLSPIKFMEPTDMFVAEPGKPHAAQAFAALIEAMISMDQVAIARFVARKNAAPKVVALIPNSPSSSGEKYYAFWSNVLPYEEDVRNYEFAPLKTRQFTPNSEQQILADKLVDSLSVRNDKADEVGSCFNPVMNRFFNAVSTRAFDDSAAIPPIPADIEASINMDPARKQQIEPLIRSFGDAFSLREAVKMKSNRKKKAFWSDVSMSLSKTVKQEATNNEDGDNEDGGDSDDGGGSDGELDLDDLLDRSNGVTTVGSMNPVADFEALIDVSSAKRHDRLDRLKAAVNGMKTQIESFLGQRDAQFHRKGLQCLAHFRKRSVDIQYAAEFNEFLVGLKASLGEESNAWDAVKREGVTLLSSDDDPSVSVAPAHARVFLYGEEEKNEDAAAAAVVSLSSQVEATEQEDDMFADFE